MSRTGADGLPRNGRTENASRQPETSPEASAGTSPRTSPEASPGTSAEEEGHLADPATRTVQLGRSWRIAVRNLLALASTIVVLTAGVAMAGALIWPKTYAARAEVLFPITQEQPTGFLREDRSMTTQLVLIRGRLILGPIAAQQGRDIEDLRDDVQATVLESSEIIQLEVRGRSEQQALQTAQAVLTGYLEYSQSGQPTLRERIETELATTSTALTDAQKLLVDQQTQVSAGTATADTVTPLQRAVEVQQVRRQQLQSQLDSVNLAPVAHQLTAPYPVGVVHPQPLVATAMGALTGLLLAAGVIVMVARGWIRR